LRHILLHEPATDEAVSSLLALGVDKTLMFVSRSCRRSDKVTGAITHTGNLMFKRPLLHPLTLIICMAFE
jgi:hypothetical protein